MNAQFRVISSGFRHRDRADAAHSHLCSQASTKLGSMHMGSDSLLAISIVIMCVHIYACMQRSALQ